VKTRARSRWRGLGSKEPLLAQVVTAAIRSPLGLLFWNALSEAARADAAREQIAPDREPEGPEIE